MKVRIAVPPWIAGDLEPFLGTRVRLTKVTVDPQDSRIEIEVSDKAVAHPPSVPEGSPRASNVYVQGRNRCRPRW